MAETADAIEPVALDDEGHLVEDVACRMCGYNLRGLGLDASCPECETAVGRSVHGDLLRYCDPAWVETLAFGMRLFVIAIVGGIGLGLLGGIALGVSLGVAGGIPVGVIIVVGAFVAALTVIQLAAYWKITQPDPGRDESEQPWTARAIARVALVLAAVTGTVAAMVELATVNGGLAFTQPGAEIVWWFFENGTQLVNFVGIAALFIYGSSLARRLPDDKLARTTRIVMWGVLATTGPRLLVSAVGDAFASTQASSAGIVSAVEVITNVIMVVAAGFWIWEIVLLFKYRNRLVAVATRARETWASPGGSSQATVAKPPPPVTERP